MLKPRLPGLRLATRLICYFHQCGILILIDSGEPVQPPVNRLSLETQNAVRPVV